MTALATLVNEYRHIRDIYGKSSKKPNNKYTEIFRERLNLTLERIQEVAVEEKVPTEQVCAQLKINSFEAEFAFLFNAKVAQKQIGNRPADLKITAGYVNPYSVTPVDEEGAGFLFQRREKSLSATEQLASQLLCRRGFFNWCASDIAITEGHINPYSSTWIDEEGAEFLFQQREKSLSAKEQFAYQAERRKKFLAWCAAVKPNSRNECPFYLDPAEWNYLTPEQKTWELAHASSARLEAMQGDYDYLEVRLMAFLLHGQPFTYSPSAAERKLALEFVWQNVLLPKQRQYVREKVCPRLASLAESQQVLDELTPYGLTPMQAFSDLCASKLGRMALYNVDDECSVAEINYPTNQVKKAFEELEDALFAIPFDWLVFEKIFFQFEELVEEWLKDENFTYAYGFRDEERQVINEMMDYVKQLVIGKAGLLLKAELDYMFSLKKGISALKCPLALLHRYDTHAADFWYQRHALVLKDFNDLQTLLANDKTDVQSVQNFFGEFSRHKGFLKELWDEDLFQSVLASKCFCLQRQQTHSPRVSPRN